MTTPTDAELIEYLRTIQYSYPDNMRERIATAADRLAALTKEVEMCKDMRDEAGIRIAHLEAEVKRLKDWEAFAATELQTAKIATEQRVQQLMASRKEIERLRKALKDLYEWYDRDGSVGGASAVFEENRTALQETNE